MSSPTDSPYSATPPAAVGTPRRIVMDDGTGNSSPADFDSGRATPAGELREPANVPGSIELEAFRKEWQAEVSRRNRHESTSASGAVAGPSSATQRLNVGRPGVQEDNHDKDDEDGHVAEARPHSPSRTRHLIQLAEEQRAAAEAEATASGQKTVPQLQPRPVPRFNHESPANAGAATRTQIKAAVQAYAHAVESERKGDLDGAVLHYRKAFRLDSAADRLYDRASTMLKQQHQHQHQPQGQPGFSSNSATVTAPLSKGMEKHKDALLASSEVADMVRRATDFDDYRAIALDNAEKTRAQQASEGSAEVRHRDIAGQADRDHNLTLASLDTPDDLDKIIAQAAQAPVEGRDWRQLHFTSPPSLIKASIQDRPDLAEKLKHTHLDAEGDATIVEEEQPSPPPPIAKLPNDVLAHICELVVEPRGRRGARIRPPKVEVSSVAQQKHPVKGHQQQQQQQQPTAPPAQSTVTTATNGIAAPSTAPSRAAASQGVGIVLAGPDWQSLETLGRVCWKWRLLTRSNATWRRILSETYYSPQLPLPASPWSITHPRQTFIRYPRLRLTGCYIAACHYSRQGLSVDNAWVKVIHLVEFYRSIRFLPDGRVLTLLTTDQPRDTVGKMHALNLDKGFAVGRWRVELPDDGSGSSEEDEQEDDQDEVKTRRHRTLPTTGARVIIDDLRDRSLAKYAFRMILQLRSTSRGKWNKMEMIEYCSVNLETGEVLQLPQKHDRPFHFSTVRSYGV